MKFHMFVDMKINPQDYTAEDISTLMVMERDIKPIALTASSIDCPISGDMIAIAKLANGMKRVA